MPTLAKIFLASFVLGVLGMIFITSVNIWRGIAALMVWLPIVGSLLLLANGSANSLYKSFRDLD